VGHVEVKRLGRERPSPLGRERLRDQERLARRAVGENNLGGAQVQIAPQNGPEDAVGGDKPPGIAGEVKPVGLLPLRRGEEKSQSLEDFRRLVEHRAPDVDLSVHGRPSRRADSRPFAAER
jgi:hypothetical protein